MLVILTRYCNHLLEVVILYIKIQSHHRQEINTLALPPFFFFYNFLGKTIQGVVQTYERLTQK